MLFAYKRSRSNQNMFILQWLQATIVVIFIGIGNTNPFPRIWEANRTKWLAHGEKRLVQRSILVSIINTGARSGVERALPPGAAMLLLRHGDEEGCRRRLGFGDRGVGDRPVGAGGRETWDSWGEEGWFGWGDWRDTDQGGREGKWATICWIARRSNFAAKIAVS